MEEDVEPARAGGREVDGSVHVARGDSALPALAAGRGRRAAAGPALYPGRWLQEHEIEKLRYHKRNARANER